MVTQSELAVTLSAELYNHLRQEAAALDIPMEWLIASMVVDSMEQDEEHALEAVLAG
jgi:hypothetical protein